MKIGILVLLSLVISQKAHAFPETVRHGYFNCTSCHEAPSGGGVLTPYGRSLSAELLSTWGAPKTAGILFTDIENEKQNPQWLRAGAFLRGVQTRRNSAVKDTAEFIPMQADVELGVDQEKFAVVATGGFRARDNSSRDLNEFFSRRYYALYRFNDNWGARAGKFLFSFGLNGPDHVTAVRRGLGWDEGSESNNLELSYTGEKASTIFSMITNSPEEKGARKDSGAAINQSFFAWEKSRIGLSAYYGQQSDFQRVVGGPYIILSLTKKVYLDSEIFFQNKRVSVNNVTQNGYATFHRIGYEIFKGFSPYLQFDRAYLDNSDRNSQFDSYGYGFQWLPHSHFELMSFFGKEKAASQDATDFWWLMMNIYL